METGLKMSRKVAADIDTNSDKFLNDCATIPMDHACDIIFIASGC